MEIKLPEPASAGIPVLSFFTGAGFLDIGFIEAGFNVVWHNEFDESFVRGFEYGMKTLLGEGHPVIENTQSIVSLHGAQILEEAFGQEVPPVFGVIGGPPCPDFSVGGKNRGETGERGQLSSTYVDRILEISPTFFLMENVPGLVRTAKHRLFLNRLLERLDERYLVEYRVLNALEYGVPQDRQRLFIVGISRQWLAEHASSKDPCAFAWPIDTRYEGAKGRFPWPDACPFGSSPACPQGVPKELTVEPYICGDEIADLPNGTEGFRPRSKRLGEVDEGDTSRKSFKRLHRWRYSPTVAYGNNEVHLHPEEARRLTVREALRLQTVPDEYSLPPDMPLSHKFKTIGNGVPVRLAHAVALAIRHTLLDCNGQTAPTEGSMAHEDELES